MSAKEQARLIPALMAAVLMSFGLSGVGQAQQERAYTGKSWVAVKHGYPVSIREGEAVDVAVDYCLDESEAVDGTHAYLQFAGLGPWNDEEKFHISYPGVGESVRIEAGTGQVTFRFICPRPLAEDLSGVDGITPAAFIFARRDDPWASKFGVESRGYFMAFESKSKKLFLDSHHEGNLFTYDEQVTIEATVRAGVALPRGQAALTYQVRNHRGKVVAQGTAPLTLDGQEQRLWLRPALKERGIFLLEAEVPGLDQETITFATVPDLPAVLQGRASQFGMCELVTPAPSGQNERSCRIARKLGLSYSRSWVYWREIEPAKGWARWEGWDNAFQAAHGSAIGVNALLFGVPAWAQRHPRGRHWQYDPPEWDAWESFCEAVARRYVGGGLSSVEFWNEPCPDGWWHDSPEALARLHKVGNRAVKTAAPQVLTTMSGGVFPQSQYTNLLAAGGGQHVDVVPIHYGDGEAVELYRAGLARFGLDKPIWDNESGRLMASFGKPRIQDITDLTQANWIPRQWTDELAHGCERIFYFMWMDAGGNWACFYPDGTPRPSVPVLAVYISKLFGTRYHGSFKAGIRAVAHAFEREGKPVLVLLGDAAEEAAIPVGSETVTVTDMFGNETHVTTARGIAPVSLQEAQGDGEPAASYVRYVEGAFLDVLLALTSAEVLPSDPLALAGESARLGVTVTNPCETAITGATQIEVPVGWDAPPPAPFAVAPGGKASVQCVLTVPASAEPGRESLKVSVEFDRPGLPACVREVTLTVIASEDIGNMMRNGGFEDGTAGEAVGWQLDGQQQTLREERLFGHTNRFLRLESRGEGWVSASSQVRARPGRKYLYSCWMRSHNMAGGSNLFESYLDGHTRNLTNMEVFAFAGNPFWELYTKAYQAPDGINGVSCVPVASGEGYAEFDDIRFSSYEGTPYAAECHPVSRPMKIDGDLSDWPPQSPLPLLGPNQLERLQDSYQWSPANLCGVAYLRWDDADLYVAAHIQDDRHVTAANPREGDALVLAFDPSFRGPDMMAVSFPLYVTQGEGRWHSVVLPEEYTGTGRKTGNLNRDGALVEIAVERTGDATVYELAIPFGYLAPLRPAFARKFGFTVGAIDNDGTGAAAALWWGSRMTRGFLPGDFGCVTFVR